MNKTSVSTKPGNTRHGWAKICLAILMIMIAGLMMDLSGVPVVKGQTFVGALTLNAGENNLYSAVIDTANGFAYFVTGTSPSIIVKIRLSDFTRVGALTLKSGEIIQANSGVIDTVNGFAYFGTATEPAVIVKVRLSDFTRVGTLILSGSDCCIASAAIDVGNGFAYFGGFSSTITGVITKVRLSDFAEVGTLTLNLGENFPHSAVIDTVNGFAYFGTSAASSGSSDSIVKVRLSDFTRVGALTLNLGETDLFSAVIDTAGGFAYFGTRSITTSPYQSVIVKIRLLDFTRYASLTLNPGENEADSAVIDTTNGLAYFGLGIASIVTVRLSDLTRQGSLSPIAASFESAVIDVAHGFAYFGTITSPGTVVKLKISEVALTFNPFASVPQPVGIAFSSAINRLIVGCCYFTGTTLRQVDSLGTVSSFAPGFTGVDEVYFAVSPGLGGFTSGTVFVGTGVCSLGASCGTIARISPDGSMVTSPWTTCTGASGAAGFGGAFRGGFTFDTVGSFGYRLLALSTNGMLFAVDPTGNCSLIANTGPILGINCSTAGACPLAEAVAVAPTTFGPYGGQAIIGGSTGYLTAVSASGVTTTQIGGFTGLGELENLNFVSSTSNSLFENSFGQDGVIVAASQFTNGDVGTLIIGDDAAPPAEGGTSNQILQIVFNSATNNYVMNTLATGLAQLEGGTIGSFIPPIRQGISVSKFFTDSSLNPLALDSNGNPMVNVVLGRTIVESTNPGQVLAWVNVTNTGSTSLQSLKLSETLPVDWAIDPPWMPAMGAIHVYFASTTNLAKNLEITQPSTITVSTGNPETVQLAIPSLKATGIGHSLLPGQSMLLSVKLTYGLIKTSQSFASYPRNYADTASAAAWTQPSYTGTEVSATSSGFFIAYAKVDGDPGGDAPIIDVSKYAIV